MIFLFLHSIREHLQGSLQEQKARLFFHKVLIMTAGLFSEIRDHSEPLGDAQAQKEPIMILEVLLFQYGVLQG